MFRSRGRAAPLRAVVVGAGVVGSATALRLAQKGAQVTLVDAGLPGDGTSGTSFAWVGASHRGLWDYFDLNVQGMAAYRRLQVELGSLPAFVRTGSLTWGDPELAERVAELRACNYSAVLLPPERVVRELEPDLVLGPEVEAVAFYPDEGFAFGRVLVAQLLEEGGRLGVTLCPGDAVVAFESSGPRVTGVALRSGARLAADAVVCCCGRWTAEVASLADVELPLITPEMPEPEGHFLAVGLLALTSPLTGGVRRVINAPDVDVRPDGAGRLLLHAESVDREVSAETPASPPPPAALELLERARRLLRSAGTARVEAATIGLRALPADLLPAVGWATGVEGLYLAVTHSGMTIGLALGELIADEVVDGTLAPALERFRPGRFAAARAAG